MRRYVIKEYSTIATSKGPWEKRETKRPGSKGNHFRVGFGIISTRPEWDQKLNLPFLSKQFFIN
jgi:hypothetical protein